MRINMDLRSAEEFDAAASFCTALANARRKDAASRPVSFGIDRAMNSIWRHFDEVSSRTVAEPTEEGVTAGEIVDALQGALKAETVAEDADDVSFPAAAAEPPKRRGPPRKEAPVVDAEPAPAAEPGQIDIEDVIASQADEQDSAQEAASGADEQDTAPQPADPAVGWTAEDGRNAARVMLNRAPEVEIGNAKLFKVLDTFGVKQVKALQPDQIEAFVIATTKEVF